MPEELVVATSGARDRGACRAAVDRRAGGQPRAAGAGEHAVIFGAGPIGQAIGLLAGERGASVLMIDPMESRLRSARRWAPRRWRGATT